MHKSLLFSAALIAAVGAPTVLHAQQTPPTTPPIPATGKPTTPTAKPDSAVKVDSAAKADAVPTITADSAAGDVSLSASPAAALAAAFEANAGISTFASLAKQAGLAEAIAEAGPVTIFAPSDEAFAKLPAEQRDALLADSTALRALLLAHVVPGRVASADAATLGTAKNAAGADLAIVAADGKVTVAGATVTQADVAAGTSVIHVIDTVLVPAPASPDGDR